MRRWIEATAWTMTPPTAYGAFHLLFLLFGVGCSAFLAYLLRRSSEKRCRRILLVIALVLLCGETHKILFYYYVIGKGSIQWNVFPFQLCTIPMYLCVAVNLTRRENVRDTIYTFLCTYNLMGGFLALLEPSGLSHGYWTMTLHSFIWHILLVFIGFFLIASGRGPKTGRDFGRATVLFLILCIMAFTINLIYFRASNGEINMFFVGPANNPLIVFKSIAARFGWYTATAIYVPCVCLGAWLVNLLVKCLTYRIIRSGQITSEDPVLVEEYVD